MTPGGRKYDPKTVAELMKTETLGNKVRFPLEERLSPQQISSYFSNRKQLLKKDQLEGDKKGRLKTITLLKTTKVINIINFKGGVQF